MALSPKVKIRLLVSISLVLASFGIIIYIAFPYVVKSEIKKMLVLKEGTVGYDIWKNVPILIYLRIYFFNITNIMEVYSQTSKPKVEEIGPYTFRESREKVDISWDSDGNAYYRQIKRWYFQPDLTSGSLDDIITTVNVPMLTAAAFAARKFHSDEDYIFLSSLFGLTNSNWFVQKSVRQLLFEGYSDKLIDKLKTFIHVPYDKFGYFYKRNGSDDGIFSIVAGMKGFDRYGEVISWNNTNATKAYGPPCNMINGSAGDLWPPFRKVGGKISVFLTDACRSLSLTYLNNSFVNKLEAYRYLLEITELDNGRRNPNHKCFCIKEKCLPSGAFDISSCRDGLPGAISFPHFLYADSYFTDGVIGLKPDPEIHTTYLDIQKDIGFPLKAASNLQINVALQPVKQLEQFSNLTETTYYPVLWFSETGSISDALSSSMKSMLYTIPMLVDAVSLFVIGTGVLLTMSALILIFVFPPRKQRKDSELVPTLQESYHEYICEHYI